MKVAALIAEYGDSVPFDRYVAKLHAALRRLEADRDEQLSMVARLRADFPSAPPLPQMGCAGDACARLRAIQHAPSTRALPTVRAACKRRMPLDGADAQALEYALTMTERERDAARAGGAT